MEKGSGVMAEGCDRVDLVQNLEQVSKIRTKGRALWREVE